jgi:UDP-glucose 6-dehydrogenase
MIRSIKDSNCIVIATEWDEFKNYDYNEIRENMNSSWAFVYDLRSYID